MNRDLYLCKALAKLCRATRVHWHQGQNRFSVHNNSFSPLVHRVGTNMCITILAKNRTSPICSSATTLVANWLSMHEHRGQQAKKEAYMHCMNPCQGNFSPSRSRRTDWEVTHSGKITKAWEAGRNSHSLPSKQPQWWRTSLTPHWNWWPWPNPPILLSFLIFSASPSAVLSPPVHCRCPPGMPRIFMKIVFSQANKLAFQLYLYWCSSFQIKL